MHHCHAKVTHLFVDEGVVIAWQLRKRTSFDEVKNLLMDLNDRFKEHKNGNLESVFLDNCSHWRKKDRKYFWKGSGEVRLFSRNSAFYVYIT